MFRAAIRRFGPKNPFARSVSVLAGGTAAGQFIVIAASPILTRLYSPEDFGLLAVYAALLGILAVVASLRYQLAIPLPEDAEEAANVAVLSLLVVAGVAALSTLIVWFWGGWVTSLLNVSALEPYLWLLPVGLALTGVYQVFNYWAIRVKAFPAIARTKLTQALSMVAVQLGANTLGPLALLLGHVTGQVAGTTNLGALAVRRQWSVFRQVRLENIRWAAQRYRRFPIYSSWGGLFNTAGTQLPAVFFAALFSPAAAGIYMLAQRVLAMPMQLLGQAIADVFFSSASEARREGTLGPLVKEIHGKLAQIAMPPVLILVLIGPDIFEWVFGGAWRQAGVFAQWMAPMVYATFVTSPISTLTSVLEKQIHAVAVQLSLLLARVGGLVVGAAVESLIVAVALFSLGTVIVKVGFVAWVYTATGNAVSDAIRESWSALIWGLVITSPLAVAVLLADSAILTFGAIGIVTIFLAMRYLHLFKVGDETS